jgi:hypothetical protein
LALLGVGLAFAAWMRRSFALSAVALVVLAAACWPANGAAFTDARRVVALILVATGLFVLGAACARWRARRPGTPSVAWPSIFAPANPAPPILDREHESPESRSFGEGAVPRRTRPPILQPTSTAQGPGTEPVAPKRRHRH